ncbi:hypothetical protein [Pseudemcibacter aquimaris]|uniref:hypothetical protein n=1 Tax=Pseudemcibacter aquimaris TaxID=2857064 RepID=UPI002011C552|nr:hypothetical protein [Pseudemcibacter aquimaris]MCC3861337.1 hypothetical protein [Pseudemcibacter aquimaris]WDU58109.1 hypothetical protein KW060_13005 [Pseudemcibacter aquimaris]
MRKIVALITLSLLLISCDNNQERKKKSLEERLVDSYAQTEQDVRDRIDIIVKASEEKDYILAMNELGMLYRTRINSKEQIQAIEMLMTDLRIAMETEELEARNARSN